MKQAAKTQAKVPCAHCGEQCDDTSIVSASQHFCCLGCKTVYEILHENGMEDYYKFEERPGISLKKKIEEWKYEYLDDPVNEKQILSFKDDKLGKATFFIPVIHCASCIWLLENIHQLRDGVISSRVDFARKVVAFDYDPQQVSLRQLVEFLSQLGYEPELNVQESERRQKRSKEQRELLVKIGIAGFCFGNIMLFSFPEYIGLSNDPDTGFSRFFGYISMAFSLPVLLYSSAGYFRATVSAVRHRTISIDVPIVLGILALFIRSSFEVISSSGSGYFDSLSGLVFFLLLGKLFQQKTYDSLLFDRRYHSYFPISVTRIINESQVMVPIHTLRPNDEILLRNQELIPADASLLSDHTYIDNSFVTGESVPVHKVYGDYIYAGGRQVGPRVRLKIEKKASQSYLTQLWDNEAFRETNEKQQLINRISKYFTGVVLGIAAGTGIYWWLVQPSIAINAFTAVLIVACPCALALSTPFAVGNAMRILGKYKIYLKRGDILERMAETTRIFFDKTGTITKQAEAREVVFEGSLTQQEKEYVSVLVSNSMHPLSRIIERKMQTFTTFERVEDFEEVKGKGIKGVIHGKRIRIGSSDFTGGSRVDRPGFSSVGVSIDGIEKGYFFVQSMYRNGIEDIIRALSNYPMQVVSGDNNGDETYLKEVFPAATLHFEQSAFDKVEEVKKAQEDADVVMMIGDGLNDSGALAQADIGVAVADDINAFTPASDIILSGASFRYVPSMLQLARRTNTVIKFSFVLSFLYNIVGLSFAVTGALTPIFAAILMPLSSISVVVFATLSIRIAASKSGFR